jgi:hypothetical protein
MHKKNVINTKTAFSFVELSIVILIIGVLVFGVIKANILVDKFRLQSAQQLTINSPVATIKNLGLWLETSLSRSFTESELIDNSAISTWNDNNQRVSEYNNATQSTEANKPLLIHNGINDVLPVVRFDGVNDFLNFDGSFLVGTDYTIFVVEQRRSSVANNYFIGATTSVTNGNLILGYFSDTVLRHSQFGSSTEINITVSAYSKPTPKIHCFTHGSASSAGKRYWGNGVNEVSNNSASRRINLSALTQATIGRRMTSSTSYYNGDIAEVIMFSRLLTTEERVEIERYLGKKFGIKVA